MKLILIILKMASGYPPWPPSFTRGAQQIGAARFSHGDVHVQTLLPLFEQLLRLYLPIYACTYISVYLYKYLSLYQNTMKNTIKNTMIELLKTSTDPQISKGVGSML